MIRRALESRAARKFRRNRQAMVALGIIVVYSIVGLAALGADLVSAARVAFGGTPLDPNSTIGLLTLQSAEQVVAPAHVRPVGVTQTPEKRLRDAGYYLGQCRKALDAAERAARRRMEREPGLNAAQAEELAIAPGLREVRFGERHLAALSGAQIRAAITRADATAAELEASDDLDADPALLPTLAELEGEVEQLFAPMTTMEGARYWVRLCAGTDRQGRSVMVRGLYSIKVAFQVGFVVASLSVLRGRWWGRRRGTSGRGWTTRWCGCTRRSRRCRTWCS